MVPFDHQTAAVANRYRATPAPLGRALSHQFASRWINPSSLLVAGQGRCRGDEPCLQAAEQEGLPSQVLSVEGGGCGHRASSLPLPMVSQKVYWRYLFHRSLWVRQRFLLLVRCQMCFGALPFGIALALLLHNLCLDQFHDLKWFGCSRHGGDGLRSAKLCSRRVALGHRTAIADEPSLTSR